MVSSTLQPLQSLSNSKVLVDVYENHTKIDDRYFDMRKLYSISVDKVNMRKQRHLVVFFLFALLSAIFFVNKMFERPFPRAKQDDNRCLVVESSKSKRIKISYSDNKEYVKNENSEFIRYTLGHRMNLQKASLQELVLLPGVGRSRARRIFLHRERGGSLQNVADLREIYSIGSKMAQNICRYSNCTNGNQI